MRTPRRRFASPRCTHPGTSPTPISKARYTRGSTPFSTARSATEMTSLVARLDLHARSDSLGQKLIALTAPGVPDVYQGTELWEDSLVDPDNRRPVDYTAHAEALKTLRHPKLRVVAGALRLRRDRAASVTDGGYTPVLADGAGCRPPRRVSPRRRCADRRQPAHGSVLRNGMGRYRFGPAAR